MAFGLLMMAAAPSSGKGKGASGRGCPSEMATLHDGSHAFCIDRYEASLEEIENGKSKPHSPFEAVSGKMVRALSRRGAVPQAYISKTEAEAACGRAQKRLCTESEWVHACEGEAKRLYPYGESKKVNACNDHGKAPVPLLHGNMGEAAYGSFTAMNDPELNRVPGTLARTGSHAKCKTPEGVFDLVGNLHEWVSDPAGTFRGGYYLDTHRNGEGCHYRTDAHDVSYHDYSTGFRCCRDRS